VSKGKRYPSEIEGYVQQETGVRVRRLCRHDTSWRTQNSHPHPALSPDDRWVVFTSDRGGKCQVYMAQVLHGQ